MISKIILSPSCTCSTYIKEVLLTRRNYIYLQAKKMTRFCLFMPQVSKASKGVICHVDFRSSPVCF